MPVLNPGQASQQMKEAHEDLKALASALDIMQGDQIIGIALDIAVHRMQVAAHNYTQARTGQQTQGQPQVRPAHRSPGVGDDRRKPYSRTDVMPPNSGVSAGVSPVSLPIPPLNTPPMAPSVQRVPAAGHVQTAPGLPDAVVPQGAQLQPRTVERIQRAQGMNVQADGAVALPAPPPAQGGDLPDVPLMDAPMPYPGAPPPQR